MSKYDYTNDDLGRRTEIDHTGTAFGSAFDLDLGYNDRNELTSATRTGGGAQTWAYAYDPIGNRQSYTLGGTPLYYCANELNQYEATDDDPNDCPGPSETFQHDEDGNLTADGDYTYEWDAENRLTRVWLVDPNPGQDENGDERLNFTYDYLGRRVRKVLEHYDGNDWVTDLDRRFVWYNWLMLLELDRNNDVVRKYRRSLDLYAFRLVRAPQSPEPRARARGTRPVACAPGSGAAPHGLARIRIIRPKRLT